MYGEVIVNLLSKAGALQRQLKSSHGISIPGIQKVFSMVARDGRLLRENLKLINYMSLEM